MCLGLFSIKEVCGKVARFLTVRVTVTGGIGLGRARGGDLGTGRDGKSPGALLALLGPAPRTLSHPCTVPGQYVFKYQQDTQVSVPFGLRHLVGSLFVI